MIEFPTLYKTKSGKVRIWRIYVIENVIHTEFGEQGGKIQHTEDMILSGKNIGKINETTKEEQAVLEAESKHNYQISRKGYWFAVEKEKEDGLISPMLAHSFDQHANKIKIPCYVQPKLDGIRCIRPYEVGKLFSRTKKEIVSVPYINFGLSKIELNTDGELYSDDFKHDFEKITGAVRKEDPLTYEEAGIQYHIYDLVYPAPFSWRLALLNELNNRLKNGGWSHVLKVVRTEICNSLEEINFWHDKFVEEGYEGLIIRNADGLYEQDKRSFNLQKYKKFMDAEFPIIGIEEGRGKLRGHVAAFICQLPDQRTFKAKMDGSLERLRAFFLDHSLWKGKKLTVKFQGYSAYGIPRFAVGIEIRDYE